MNYGDGSKMEFIPSITNLDKHEPTVAFGFRGSLQNKNEFCDYLKTTKLSQLFSEDKLYDLCNEYVKHSFFIRRFIKWARWFLYDKDPSNRPEVIETDDQMIEQWSRNVLQFYELYRISESLYERILYTQLLNDHLWNPKLDPRNPKIQDYYKRKLSDIEGNIRNTSLVESTIVESFNANDADSYKLIKSGLNNDLISIYNRSFSSIRNMNESSVDINALKTEVAKLKFMQILIENDLIYTDFQPDSELYSKYSVLRKSIKKSLKDYIDKIKAQEDDFDLDSFYESTNFYKFSVTEYHHVNLYKEFIRDNF